MSSAEFSELIRLLTASSCTKKNIEDLEEEVDVVADDYDVDGADDDVSEPEDQNHLEIMVVTLDTLPIMVLHHIFEV